MCRDTAFPGERFKPVRTCALTTGGLVFDTYHCVYAYLELRITTILLHLIVPENHKLHPIYPVEITNVVGKFSHSLTCDVTEQRFETPHG
jgi:hypothetical protein